MRIKSYNQFINEKKIPQQSDSVTTASDKNYFNDEEELIQKFNSYKVDIENIYKTYSDKKDLMNKIFNKGFIHQKTEDPKKIRFKNKYLGKWARICDKKREIQDIEKVSSDNENDIKNHNQTISDNKGNDSVISAVQSKVDAANDRLNKNKIKIEEIQKDIFDLDKQLKKDFDELKKRHNDSKNRINKEEMTKMSNSAEVDNEQAETPQ